MSAPLVRVNVHEPIGTIILNRPDKRNALSRELLGELSQALFDMHMQKSVRAVVITGAGSAFCAGMDLGEMLATNELEDPRQQWYEDSQQYRELLEAMLRFPKPLIAAVNGPAVAGGAGLVLGCDIVLAAEEAKFGLPEPKRGVVAGMVMPLLAFRLGGGQAARLALTTAVIDAAEGHRIGLFHEVMHGDKLWPRGMEIASECATCAPEAMQMTKRMLNETVAEHLFTALAAGTAISATARTTENAAEGLKAFLEKREPKWL